MANRSVKEAPLELKDVVEIAGLGQFVVAEIIERGDRRISIRLDRKYNSSLTLEVLKFS